MSKQTRYSLASCSIVLVTAIALFFFVRGDEQERSFYSSGGIMYFAQYFILSSGTLALFFSLAGAWQSWIQPITTKTWIITLFVHFPFTLLSVLLVYAGLLFLGFI